MEKNPIVTELNEKQQSLWSASDKSDILKVLGIVALGQKNYGKTVNVNDLFYYFELKLNGRFTAQQVIAAISQYTDKQNDIPTPADIINILDPEEPKITYAEYKNATELWKKNGYNSFCYYRQKMLEYEAQGEKERKSFKEHSESMQKLGVDTTKLLKNI